MEHDKTTKLSREVLKEALSNAGNRYSMVLSLSIYIQFIALKPFYKGGSSIISAFCTKRQTLKG